MPQAGKPPARTAKAALWIGLALVVLSTLIFGGLLLLPFAPLSAAARLALAPLLVVAGEAAFWIGGVLLGKEVVTRHRKYLDPRTWFGRKR